MVAKRGKQASRKAAARKYGFLEVPYNATGKPCARMWSCNTSI
ncbi:MAG: hypothetical protein Q8K59_04485 [Nitrosomonas sp.]|nr:hypothetical protein [Nitrosomonas sp.]MDP1950347.1 hypothetical protein [Nitrosomonas sp.]